MNILPEQWKTMGPMPIILPLVNHCIGTSCAMITWWAISKLGHALFTSEAMLAKIDWWEMMGVDIILGILLLVIFIDFAKIIWLTVKEFNNTHAVVVA